MPTHPGVRRSSSVPGTDTVSTHRLGGTCLEDTTMVPSAVADVGCNATPDNAQSSNNASASCVAYLRETRSFRRKLPHPCLDHGELRPTDLTTHPLASGQHSWCSSRGSDPFSSPIREVVTSWPNYTKRGISIDPSIHTFLPSLRCMRE